MAADLLFAIGVAASNAGVRSFQSRRFTVVVSSSCPLSCLWLGYAALDAIGEWRFSRFVPAVEGDATARTAGPGARAYSVELEVEDWSGGYSGTDFHHTLVPLALGEDGIVIGFDSREAGVAAVDFISREKTVALSEALSLGDVFAMRAVLCDRRFLTPSVDGALVAFPSGEQVGTVRAEAVLRPQPAGFTGMDCMGLFPRREF